MQSLTSRFPPEFAASRGRSALLLAGALALCLGASSCSFQSKMETVTMLPIPSQTVEADPAVVEALLPDEFRPPENQQIQRETFSIDRGGRFTLTRTLEQQVGRLGLGGRDLTPSLAEERGLEPFSGVLVHSVNDRSSSGESGLEPGDVIVRFAGKETRSVEHLSYLITTASPGGEVSIEFRREGEATTRKALIRVEATSRLVQSKAFTRDLGIHDDLLRAGFKLLEIPEDIRRVMEESEGASASGSEVLICTMIPGGPSFYSDLRIRDVLQSVNGVEIRTLDDYIQATRDVLPGEEVAFQVRRGGRTIETGVEYVENAGSSFVFNFLGLIHVQGQADHSSFGLIFDLLFNYHNWRMIHKVSDLEEDVVYRPAAKTKWGMVLDLIAYSTSPEKFEFTLLWFLPITVDKT